MAPADSASSDKLRRSRRPWSAPRRHHLSTRATNVGNPPLNPTDTTVFFGTFPIYLGPTTTPTTTTTTMPPGS